jgi:glutamine synthetase
MSALPNPISAHVELLFSDMNGVPRGKVIDGSSLKPGYRPHMGFSLLFQTINGEYADILDRLNPKDEDMQLEPDWSTYRATPWKEDDHSQVICRSLNKNGQPTTVDSRNVLLEILGQYALAGWFPIVAPEVEFYLVQPVQDPRNALVPATGQNGRLESGGESFSIDALDKFEDFFATLRQTCAKANIQLEGLIHEMGPGQIELNVGHGDALDKADQLFLLKRAVKACALKCNMTATFMAKPIEAAAGSGLHIHTSMNDADGNNVFALQDGQAKAMLRYYIGGLQHYLPRAFALFSPSINSYKRFVPDLSAPVNLEWGYDNRTTGFRIPYDTDENGRVENRIAGADANPYLFTAATLACGLLGIREKLEPRAPVEGNAYYLKLPAAFPRDLGAALVELQNCQPIIDLIGKDFIDSFVSIKQMEIDHFQAEISLWEQRYLCELL